MSDNRGIGRNVTQKIKRAAAVEPLEGRLCFSVFAAGYALPLAGTRMESLRPRATTFEQHERSLFTRAALAATAAAANCDPSGPAAATSAASTTASAAVAPTRFAQKIAVSRADELRELFVRIDPRPEIRIAERLFLERAQRFERQTAPPPAPGTSSGEARGSDDSVGSTVGSAVTPATPVSAPPVVELIVIEQVLVVPAPPPTTTEAGGAPATKGTAAGRNVTPQAAGDSPATAAVTTAVVRPVLSAAAALRASAVGASTSAAVQTVEAVATTAATAVAARFASAAPVVTATGAWGRVAAMDSSVTQYVQEFGGVAGVARVVAAVEQVLGAVLPGGSGELAPTADASAATQRTYEFAHMGWPLSLLADSMANFAEDSAATAATAMPAAMTRGLASTPGSTGAWAVTASVIAADVVVLTYINRRGARRRRRQQQQQSFAVRPMIA